MARTVRAAVVLALLAAGLFIQIHFLRSYPQPGLFGDPGAYYIVGQKLQQAAARAWEGEPVSQVFESVRGYLYFLGIGSLYAFIDALRRHDIAFFRTVLAVINTLGMAGAFLLGRRLGGFVGGVVALGLAALYPSFSVQTGRLYPEGIHAGIFAWSAFFYVRGVKERRPAWMVAAGLVLGLGFFLRAQLMSFFPIFLTAALLASSPFWLRKRDPRNLVAALVLASLPAAALWQVVVRSVGDDLGKVEEFGFWVFPKQHRYPYGFWMFLDADGWLGPYQLGTYPFYRALQEEAKEDPELLTSRLRQYLFTGRYVLRRPGESSLLVLDNVYRLYSQPTNDYQWDYPFPKPYQSLLQKAIVVLALAGIVFFTAEAPPVAGILFVPLTLAVTSGLSYPLPRYNEPGMLILIAVAGAFLARASPALRKYIGGDGKSRATLLAVALLGSCLFALERGLFSSLPEVARWLGVVAALLLLSLPFLAAYAASGGSVLSRRLSTAVWSVLALVVTAHFIRDDLWHEISTTLGKTPGGVEHQVSLSAEALARLRRASQAFLVLDLRTPTGSLEGVTLEVNGKAFPGSSLLPTMPRFGEQTTSGGRDPRAYRQWWALPLTSDLLPGSAPAVFSVKLLGVGSGKPLSVYGDRFRDQERSYEGPSFGNWPHLASLKLEYDGDYRLPVRLPLGSAGTRSYVLGADGSRREIRGLHRIRILTLGSNEGRLVWETADVLSSKPLAAEFFAYSGKKVEAELIVEDEPVLRFPLGSRGDFDIRAPPYTLCHRTNGPRGDMAYGGYSLTTPPRAAARPLRLAVRFHSGMSTEALFFSVDLQVASSDLDRLSSACRTASTLERLRGAARVVESRSYPDDSGHWTVTDVF